MTSKHPKLIGIVTGRNNAELLTYLIPAWVKEGLAIIYIDQNSQDNSIEIAERFVGKGIIDLFSFTNDNPGTELKIESLKNQLKQKSVPMDNIIVSLIKSVKRFQVDIESDMVVV